MENWCSFRQRKVNPQSTTTAYHTRQPQRLITITIEVDIFLYPIFVVFYNFYNIKNYMMQCSIYWRATFSNLFYVCFIANVSMTAYYDGWVLSHVSPLGSGFVYTSFLQCLFLRYSFLSLSCLMLISTQWVIIQAWCR